MKLGTAALAFALLAGVAAAPSAEAAPDAWTVRGPGRVSATLDLDGAGELHLAVADGGAQVLAPGRLGITTSAHAFDSGLSFAGRRDRLVRESYAMVTGKQLDRSATMSESTFTFRTADRATVEVVVRAARDGIAYRYVLGGSGPVTVQREASTFELPAGAEAWVQPYQSAYETERTQTTAAGANTAEPRSCTGSTCSFGYPTLFKTGGRYALLTESDVDGRYSGTHLDHADGATAYTVALADGRPVTANGPLATPWRTAIVGSLDTVVRSTLVDDLAPPSKVRDTSWIKPGVADWSWLTGGVEASASAATQRSFIDYAAAHGLSYTLVDYGWQESEIPGLVRYARARGVDLVLWFAWTDLETQQQRDRWLPELKSWGVAGVKVDYMNSDAQSQFRWYDAILADTARLHLMIDFHGATVPRGLQRTWPQVMSVEAVRGEENGQDADRDVFLAFTRNIVGSMDYTPAWFSRPGRQDSPGHELAQAVVFESGWTHLGDDPAGFATQPAAERYFEQLPTTWDDTRLAAGSPERDANGDRQVVLARRNGDRWFIGGLLAGPAGVLSTPLGFLGRGRWLVETTSDQGGTLTRTTSTHTAADTLKLTSPANGGFAAIACPAAYGRTTCDNPVVPAPATTLTLTPSTAAAAPGSTLPIGASFVLPQGAPLHDVRLDLEANRLPAGWRATGRTVRAGTLRAGTALTGRWTVTVPAAQQGTVVEVPVAATYARPGHEPVHVEQVVSVKVPPHGTVGVSTLPFESATNGWGPVERDRSNGETGAGDGRPLTLHGTVYPRGIGANATSDVKIFLGGRCTGFTATVGIDDEVASSAQGSVTFSVLGDGKTRTATPVLTSASGPVGLTADVTGAQELDLVLGDGGNGSAFDHGDWAAPELTCRS
ncbi:glycoside hydrolase family 97 catalytic domain-containing protein [Amycolatopsis sp. PS_44_ISF1]|uniref:glycoside hydrolase family 97 catalytic domain-containing protein n=1 Tax=Amycolatopsis sp. PS_44_ISF1 TaxID=2974917 RepID=UPI0028DE710C|nr:glycoside hydrolase family 97 catalytic domain-containing protein [Amycolatopsis sp. PS_44_ISF1]MDT8915199.1 glycoside hydrolase family 97 catalytic domain-containing protein [Amycolatopsis sp. PS_44_ISF1]